MPVEGRLDVPSLERDPFDPWRQYQAGQTTRIEYVASNDGKDYPVQGSSTIETVSAWRIDAQTIDLEYKRGGKVVQTLRSRLSADGKTMTVTPKGTNAQGQAVRHTLVYEKQ